MAAEFKTLREFVNEDSIIDTPLFGTGPEPTPEPTDPEKHKRITNNLNVLAAGGASISKINEYLKSEGESLFVDPTFKPGKEPVTMRSLSNTISRGAFTGVMSLGSILTLGVDMMDTAVRQAGYLAEQALQFKQPKMSDLPKFQRKLTEAQGAGTELLADTIFGEEVDPERQHFIERATGQVSEFVAPGSLITYGMTKAGARLIAKSPAQATFFQKMLMDTARNPAKAQALEFGYSTAAGISGESAVTLAAGGGAGTDLEHAQWIRLGAELGSILPSVLAQHMIQGLRSMAKSKFALGDEHVRRAAELEVGKFFSILMEIDPKIAQRIDDALRLSAETGVQFNTAQAAQNPNIQKAFELMLSTHDTAATRFAVMTRASKERAEKFINDLAPIMQANDPKDFRRQLRLFSEKHQARVDKQVNAVVKKAQDEVMALHPNKDVREAGESAIKQLDILRDEGLRNAESIYDKLDNAIEFPVKWIQRGVAEAQISKKAWEAWRVAKEQGRELARPLERGNPYGGVADDIIESFNRNFAESDKASLLAIREFRQEVNKFKYEALKFGDDDTVHRLDRMLIGIDKQLRVASNKKLRGNAATTLRDANNFYRDINDKFNRGLGAVVWQRDVAGRRTFAPEDFARHFIRPGKRKDSIETVRAYQKMFGDSGNAKRFIEDSFATLLHRELAEAGGEITQSSLNRLTRFTLRHKASLKEHGVWDRFNSITKLSEKVRSAVSTGKVVRENFENLEFNQALGFSRTDDPRGYMIKQMKAGNLGTLRGQVDLASKPAARSFRRQVWDLVLEESEGSVIKRDADGMVIRKPDEFNTLLTRHQKDLRGALGDEHFEHLEKIGEVWHRMGAKAESEVVTRAFGTELSRVERFSQRQLGRALSKIRASLQGFVSPQFTALQLANQAFDLINSGVAHEVFLQALIDPNSAKHLASLAQDAAGKEMLRMIGIASITPAVAQAATTEDARTEVN